MDKKFNEEQGQALVKVARQTIKDALGIPDKDQDHRPEVLQDEGLLEKRGVFVTLTKHGQLRGCIGFLEGRESVLEAVRQNALNAAFHDPRFSPVKAPELNDIDIEVSILTDPQILEYRDAQDLVKKLRPGIDGVIIRYGYHSSTFLPQVWEQLPTPEEFLSHLCLKGGLPADSWKKNPIEVQTYQVEYFEEQS